jgi:hypothetical protein
MVSITLFQFDELSDKAQEKAIYEHRNFMLSTMTPTDFISGCPEYDTPEKLQEAYDLEYDYYLMEDEPIIESIQINEYWFFCDGTLANVTAYPNGRNVFKFHGESDVFYMDEED